MCIGLVASGDHDDDDAHVYVCVRKGMVGGKAVTTGNI